jgi:methylmalonyl-CoA/ethylmalonyl-CoA epimerase
MEGTPVKTNFGAHFTQVAWVVKDIKTAEKFFQNVIGVGNFSKAICVRAQEFQGTYYGQPSDADWLVSVAYSGGSFLELIQPLSGRSIFRDYLDKNPAGGVQHVAYSIPSAELDKVISGLTEKGYQMITSINMPVAKIVFFDTYKELGVVTEIIGITDEGNEFVEKLKRGTT